MGPVKPARGPWGPTLVLAPALVLIALPDLATWWMHRVGYPAPYEYWLEGTLGPLAFGIVGWFIATRVPSNRLGPLMLAIPVAGATQAAAGVLGVIGVQRNWGPELLATLGGTFKAAQTCTVSLLVVILLVVPTGRPLNRFFGIWLRVVVVATVFVACGDFLRGTDISSLHGGPSGHRLAPHTIGLVAVYFIIVATFTRFVPTQNHLGVAAATLAAAAIARPLLRRVQARVDRRFNRARYDGEQAVRDFGSRLRKQVDPDAVLVDLRAAVFATVQPTGLSLWRAP